jgi:hypothetical protein
MEIKRNDPCPCGSGKKYKKCCGLKEAKSRQEQRSLFNIPLSSGPVKSLSERLIKVLGSKDTIQPPDELPESTASTEAAENPELTPPM